MTLAVVFTLVLAACGGDDDDQGVVAGDDGSDSATGSTTGNDGSGGGDPDREEPADDPFGDPGAGSLASGTVDGEHAAPAARLPPDHVDWSTYADGTVSRHRRMQLLLRRTLVEGDTLFEGFGSVTEMACDPPEVRSTSSSRSSMR